MSRGAAHLAVCDQGNCWFLCPQQIRNDKKHRVSQQDKANSGEETGLSLIYHLPPPKLSTAETCKTRLERTERLSVGISNRQIYQTSIKITIPDFQNLCICLFRRSHSHKISLANVTKSCYTAAVLYCLNFKEVPEQLWDAVGQQQG